MPFLPDTECICGHNFPKHVSMSAKGSFAMMPCSDKDIIYGIDYDCNCEYFEEYYGDRYES